MDYLAEVTMSILAKTEKQRNPNLGYATDLD
jgi:hypothetical protein